MGGWPYPFFGELPILVDPFVPEGEVHLKVNGKVVGRIVNIGKDPQVPKCPRCNKPLLRCKCKDNELEK